jgi:hypothetical protein
VHSTTWTRDSEERSDTVAYKDVRTPAHETRHYNPSDEDDMEELIQGYRVRLYRPWSHEYKGFVVPRCCACCCCAALHVLHVLHVLHADERV